MEELLETGKTFQYSELPDRLWATTGYKIKDVENYQNFGRLRNKIQHFVTPSKVNLMQTTLEFVFKNVDPLINDFWKLFAVDYVEDLHAHDQVFSTLLTLEIPFLVPEHHKEKVESIRKSLSAMGAA